MSSIDQDPLQFLLSDSAHTDIFETEIIPDRLKNAQVVNSPVAIVFGGQPGSGKSAVVDAATEELKNQGGCILIVGDELRDYHPDYSTLLMQDDKTAAFYTDMDTGRWIEKLINHVKGMKYNLIIEGTMRVPEKVAETMRSLRAAGYFIEARALAVNERLSWQGVLQRYESQCLDRGYGRMTMPKAHQAGYVGMLSSLEKIEQEKLANKVSIYKRDATLLYENELENNTWKNAPQARQIVEKERSREWTLKENIQYAESYDKLHELLKRPERNASQEELHAVELLKQKAHDDLAIAQSKMALTKEKTYPTLI